MHFRPISNVKLHMLFLMLMSKISCSCWVALDWLGTCEVQCLKWVSWWWWWWWWWYSGDCSDDGGDQCAKEVVSHSLGLVDFAILPMGKWIFCGARWGGGGYSHYRRTVINAHQKFFRANWNDFWASTCWLQLAQMAGSKTDFLCTLVMMIYDYIQLMWSSAF